MFLAVDDRLGLKNWVFTWKDRCKDDYQGEVVEGVELNYDLQAVHVWHDGQEMPKPCLGQDPKNAKFFKVFRNPNELHPAKLYPTARDGSFIRLLGRYCAIINIPEEADEAQWFDYLDELDEAAR